MADNPLTDPEEFQTWADHRLTKAFRDYLKDWQLQMAMQWAQGHPLTPEQQAEAATVGFLSDLKADDVRKHYDLEPIDE